jgi:PadR family transcriptional regulator, regulatory protein PadR
MQEDQFESLLNQWEQSYKRGLLSFWILLMLHGKELYAYEMREAIREMSEGGMVADDNSIYRALKRFAESGLIGSEKRPSPTGPPRRYFALTETGEQLLAAFIQRNILIFQQPHIMQAMENVMR